MYLAADAAKPNMIGGQKHNPESLEIFKSKETKFEKLEFHDFI